jgi:hypothetical protein
VIALYHFGSTLTQIAKVQRDAAGKLSTQVTNLPGMVLLRLSTNNGRLAAEF